MLKITNKINLKELEKFEFKEYEKYYHYLITENYGEFIDLNVWKDDRLITLEVNYDSGFTEDIDILFDLIQAGLVEKV